MKKITFLVAVMMLIGSMAFSQFEAKHFKMAKELSGTNLLSKVGAATCDTMLPLSLTTGTCMDSLGEYTTTALADSGFLTGMNLYPFPDVAMLYKAPVGSTISDVIIMFGVKAGVTGATAVTIYSSTGTGSTIKPNANLGTSATILKGAIDTSNYGINFNNVYHLSTKATLTTANFFVALSIPTNFTVGGSDTNALAVMDMAANTCNAVDSAGFFKYGSTWYSMMNGVGQNIDMMIFPIVCSSTVGMQEYSNSVVGVFPNPSNALVNVVSTKNIETVRIINTIGQTVYENNIGQKYARISTSDLKPGIYFVQVKDEDGITTKSLQVIR